MENFTKTIIAAIEARLAWEALPFRVEKSRNGWAAYKATTRITRFYFSEDGAREAAIEWEASDVKVQF